MKILAIDTSTDETAAAVTQGIKVLSNIIWSQASLHAKWGGVYPSLAKRVHLERIDWVVSKALSSAKCEADNINAIAVGTGPGLAVAIEVGLAKAKKISLLLNKPFIAINHVEGHLLSVLAKPKTSRQQRPKDIVGFPAIGLVASGGTTQLVLIMRVGTYEILAHTIDDALGEALDKAARMLGLGYPGGPILEIMAKEGDPKTYNLPIPMLGKENRSRFSYSGIKTAMYKLVQSEQPLTKEKVHNLAASFQDKTFQHVERLIRKVLETYKVKEFFLTGGVSANIELRKRIRKICNEREIILSIPYSKKLCTDNAAMIGIAANFKFQRGEIVTSTNLDLVDRVPRARVDKKFPWEK